MADVSADRDAALRESVWAAGVAYSDPGISHPTQKNGRCDERISHPQRESESSENEIENVQDRPQRFDGPPEAAALIQRQYGIDRADAGPKAPVSGFRCRGVQIGSRWSVLAELDTMRRIIDVMPELMARRLEPTFPKWPAA